LLWPLAEVIKYSSQEIFHVSLVAHDAFVALLNILGPDRNDLFVLFSFKEK